MPTLRRLLGAFDDVRARRATPPPEDPADEEYAARHLIRHTLDRHAQLRRLAPLSDEAAARYGYLLSLELEALSELETMMRHASGGADLDAFLTDARHEMSQLRAEVAWCRQLLLRHATAGATAGSRAGDAKSRTAVTSDLGSSAHAGA
jgi:hypothetical protein